MDSSIEGQIGDALFEIYESVRNNEKTLEQLEWFNNMSRKRLNTLINNPAKYFVDELQHVMNKFELYSDLGEITVPSDYVRGEYYDHIPETDLERLYFEGKLISKKNTPFPSSPLRKGAYINIKLFKQKVGTTSTSDERMLFLVANNSMFLGMQGITFLIEHRRNDLEIDVDYSSFEKPANSLRDKENRRLVPTFLLNNIDEEDDSDIIKFNSYVETVWDESNILVCFTEDF